MTGCSKCCRFFGSLESQLRTHCRSLDFLAIHRGRQEFHPLTWYLVSKVLQTPVKSIIATRNGTTALVVIVAGNAVSISGRADYVGKVPNALRVAP